MPSYSAKKWEAPDLAHLRVLWRNNSKCLFCIVWHAAGGALKPLLPLPKAPLNKIVKNNSFTLILPSDQCTQGGKLAAGLHASLPSLKLLHLFWQLVPPALCLSARASELCFLDFIFFVFLCYFVAFSSFLAQFMRKCSQ